MFHKALYFQILCGHRLCVKQIWSCGYNRTTLTNATVFILEGNTLLCPLQKQNLKLKLATLFLTRFKLYSPLL